MSNVHCTEEEIQEYAISSNNCTLSIKEHMRVCSNCSSKAAGYSLLFKGIKEQERPLFDYNLAEAVLTELEVTAQQKPQGNIVISLLLFAALALSCVAVYLFHTYLANLLRGITPLMVQLSLCSFIIVTILVSIDMYKTYQKKIKALDFY